ncbi:MAG: type II toxin-antitoxin system HicB family antitoxin [Acidobacteria bacterium]|nr:type II toxin-antitoxin system HicB family antitoxin [Acidobacteriota bacterium]
MMELTFTAVFEEVPSSEGGGYCAYVEELPGANTQGETLDDARENLKDAIKLLLETRREMLGEEVVPHRIIREQISVKVG